MTATSTPTAPATNNAVVPPNLALTLQLLEWLERQPRSYRETLEAWQSHCPRFTIWEDAHSLGLVRNWRVAGIPGGIQVTLTDAGRALLAEHQPT